MPTTPMRTKGMAGQHTMGPPVYTDAHNALQGEAIAFTAPSPTSVAETDPIQNPTWFENSDFDNFDDATAATINDDRLTGPIDLDTCTRHRAPLTPDEIRSLRAMRRLGHDHLRGGEVREATNVFAEILRGRRERHGRRSCEAAGAMMDLGSVMLSCAAVAHADAHAAMAMGNKVASMGNMEEVADRYRERAAELLGGAAVVRAEVWGKDHIGVAVSSMLDLFSGSNSYLAFAFCIGRESSYVETHLLK